MRASVFVEGIDAKEFNNDKVAQDTFCDAVEEVTKKVCIDARAKEVPSEEEAVRRLADDGETEVSFTIVVEELVDLGVDYASASDTILTSVTKSFQSAVKDGTFLASLASAAEASGSDVLASVVVDVDASVVSLEDATWSTFEVTAVSETAAPTPKLDAAQTPAPVASPGKKLKKKGKKKKAKTKKKKKKTKKKKKKEKKKKSKKAKNGKQKL